MDFIPSFSTTLNLISSGLRPEHFPRIAVSLFHQERADDQRIHARAEKRSHRIGGRIDDGLTAQVKRRIHDDRHARAVAEFFDQSPVERDRKSTRLNSSHGYISYAVFCLKK